MPAVARDPSRTLRLAARIEVLMTHRFPCVFV
jgi:hypothetical protein